MSGKLESKPGRETVCRASGRSHSGCSANISTNHFIGSAREMALLRASELKGVHLEGMADGLKALPSFWNSCGSPHMLAHQLRGHRAELQDTVVHLLAAEGFEGVQRSSDIPQVLVLCGDLEGEQWKLAPTISSSPGRFAHLPLLVIQAAEEMLKPRTGTRPGWLVMWSIQRMSRRRFST